VRTARRQGEGGALVPVEGAALDCVHVLQQAGPCCASVETVSRQHVEQHGGNACTVTAFDAGVCSSTCVVWTIVYRCWLVAMCHLALTCAAAAAAVQVLLQGLPRGALEVAQGAVQGTEQGSSSRCSSRRSSSIEVQPMTVQGGYDADSMIISRLILLSP
jgi:hypothetical protein